MEDIIRETGSGWIVHPHKPAEIGKLLHKVITDTDFYHSLHPERRKIEQFSVKRQLEKLSKIIEEL